MAPNLEKSSFGLETGPYSVCSFSPLKSAHTTLGQIQLLIPMAKYIPSKSAFCSIHEDKIMGEKIFGIIYCLLERQADMHQCIQPDRPGGWY